MNSPSRRDVLKGIGSASVLAVGGVGAASASGKGRQEARPTNTIFDIVESSENFDTLESALEATGLDRVLGTDAGQYTVFAPTDDAFGGVDLSGLNRGELANILLYHVTYGRRDAEDVLSSSRIRMLNGEFVHVDGTNLNGDQADIIETNIEASNGIVHVIDGVLLP